MIYQEYRVVRGIVGIYICSCQREIWALLVLIAYGKSYITNLKDFGVSGCRESCHEQAGPVAERQTGRKGRHLGL